MVEETLYGPGANLGSRALMIQRLRFRVRHVGNNQEDPSSPAVVRSNHPKLDAWQLLT